MMMSDMSKLRERMIAVMDDWIDNDAEAEKDKEWPQGGDNYCFIDGNARSFVTNWSGCPVDIGRKSIGNCFKTREHAEQDRDAKRVETELRSQPGRKAFVNDEHDWSLNYQYDGISVTWWVNSRNGLFQCYFESREAAQAALEAVGADRIKAAIDWLATKEG